MAPTSDLPSLNSSGRDGKGEIEMLKNFGATAPLLFLATVSAAAVAFAKVNPFLEKPPVLRHLRAHVEIERTFVDWDGPHWKIETAKVCVQDVDVPVYDVRGRPKLRPQAESVAIECPSLFGKEEVTLALQGRAEVLRPKDMDGWVTGSRDLLRLFFTLDAQAAPESPAVKDLPSMATWEFFTGDLASSQAMFRLSPPELVSLTCERNDEECRVTGPESVYRAHVELKPAP